MTNQDWLQAQYSVLGSALIESSVVSKVVTETSEEDYTLPCRTVYQAMRKLFSEGVPVDVVSVKDALGGKYTDFLLQLMEITPTAANIDHYIALCKEQARVLTIRELGSQLMAAENSKTVLKILEQANKLMVKRQRRKRVNMADALKSFMDRHTKPVKYLPWPIKGFSKDLHVEQGDYIVIGAEPSVGKTAFVLQCAWYWAREMKVGFFSFETNPQKLFDRKMASVAGLQMSSIKNNTLSETDWAFVAAESPDITSRNLDLIPAAGYTTTDIRAEILDAGYDLIIVDYLQIVAGKGHNRTEVVTNISIDLHAIAQSLGVIIVALSQLSRIEGDRAPTNSDLRESGQIEQDADVILLMHLENKSNPKGPRKLTATKNKEGETFRTTLIFDGEHQTFSKSRPGGREVARDENQFTMLPGDTEVPWEKR